MGPVGYKSGSTTGGKVGCAVAALVGLPMLGFALLVGALGGCAITTNDCTPLWQLVAIALLGALAVGLLTRLIVNAVLRRRQGED